MKHQLDKVTPFVGVWIEICIVGNTGCGKSVTPFVGVWIEILNLTKLSDLEGSHSLRGSVD